MISFISAENPPPKPGKTDQTPFNMLPKEMLEKGEWGYDPETNTGWFGIREGELTSEECVTSEQYKIIFQRLEENITDLKERRILPETPSRTPTDFTWPLEATENFSANDYWAISGFVDQNPSPNQILDYNCGERTYDGHNGTDYFIWPHAWNMMDNEEVAIIAAAPGTIIDKYSLNYDRRCDWSGYEWNAVYIQHDDGSVAMYGHMKLGSLTSKNIGETVERGEFLGLVGSSGNSTGPHLHLEIRDENWEVVDPYQGPCNEIGESHWEDQHDYRVPGLLRSGTYGFRSWWMECPEPSILNYRDHFVENEIGYHVSFFRDVYGGIPFYYQIIDPNGDVLNSFPIIPNWNYTTFWWWWGGMLVDDGNFPPGVYDYRVSLYGENFDQPYYWNMDGCTDPSANNYDPDAMYDNGTCLPCNTGSEIKIALSFDNYPEETFWTINDDDNVNNFMSGGGMNASFYTDRYCASPGIYQVTIYDTYGDGMCCEFGEGGYSILVDDVQVASGSYFGYEDITTVVIEGGSQGTVEAEYNSGWNLVGLPVESDNSSYETLFPNAYSGTLYSFDAGYVESEQLENGTGYWLRMEESGTVEFTGVFFDEISVSVVEGWNIVSGPSENAGMSDPDGLVFDGTVYGFNGSYVNSDVFEPGKGYWLRSSGDGTVTLTSDVSRAKQGSSMRDQYIAQSSKIRFSNGDGNTVDLFTGANIKEEDMPMFSLPPVPAMGGFDVRFSGDTKYCSTDDCLIEVMNDGSPLTIECETKDGEVWEIVDESGNMLKCEGVQVLEVSGKSETLVLRKTTSPQTPAEFSILSAFPNPFNPITTIQFSVPDVETLDATSIRIYDITGKLVETLVDEKLSPGNHSVHWNANGFSSGVYVTELVSGNNREIQKIILLK
jgi:murein DD-endopeptidase MepM/ murein hydrolase activator NlpD